MGLRPGGRIEHGVAAARRTIALSILTVLLSACQVHYSWLQWALNASHSGNATLETTLTTQNVGGLHQLFEASLPAPADGAPAYLANASVASGSEDLLFVTTTAGDLVALDAHSGAQVWWARFGPGGCTINNGGTPCYTTSSPAVDPGQQFVYSYGLDGDVHKVAIATGQEVVDSHWPEVTTLKGYDEKGSSALTVATARSGVSFLYVTHAGYPGDAGDYQGHITAVNLTDGTQRVFNTLCSNIALHFTEGTFPDCPEVQAGVWARSGVVYDPSTDRIYVSSGNGTYAPTSHDWGDSVIALNPDATGNAVGDPVDAYTPTDYLQLQLDDSDLGSTAPAVLPVRDTRKVAHLGLQGGKDQQVRLLDLDNLSGSGGPGQTGGELAVTPVPQGGELLTTPAVWTNPSDGSTWAFVATDSGTAALELVFDASGNPQLLTRWVSGSGGTTPVVADGVLFVAQGTRIAALDAATGQDLWQDTSLAPLHWQSPIVANGVVYVEDGGGHVNAYGL